MTAGGKVEETPAEVKQEESKVEVLKKDAVPPKEGVEEKRKVNLNDREIVIDNLSINYVKYGSGPIQLVMIPDYFGTWRDFQTIFDNFEPDKYTLVSFDPPGYGKSRPPDRLLNKKYTADLCIRDAELVIALMKKLKLTPFAVAGYGEGLRTALHVCHKTPLSLVPKAVVYNGSTFVSSRMRHYHILMNQVEYWPESMKKPLYDMYGEKLVKQMYRAITQFHIDARKTPMTRTNPKGDICTSILKEIQQPVFQLLGHEDYHLAADNEAIIMNDLMPNVRLLRESPKGQHVLHDTDTEWFIKCVKGYLNDEPEYVSEKIIDKSRLYKVVGV